MVIVPQTGDEPRINDRIRSRELRVIDPDGNQLGVLAMPDALRAARNFDLDLVEVAPLARPPVAKIMDYRKYKYEVQQRAKESRRKSTNIVVKEMKYRPKIGTGDFDTKTRKVLGFLEDGSKVKITIMFRGREMQHPEHGRRILDRIAEAAQDLARIEASPRQDGRNMTMVLAPDKKVQAFAQKRREAEAREAQADAEGAAARELEPADAKVEPPEIPVAEAIAVDSAPDDGGADPNEAIVSSEGPDTRVAEN